MFKMLTAYDSAIPPGIAFKKLSQESRSEAAPISLSSRMDEKWYIHAMCIAVSMHCSYMPCETRERSELALSAEETEQAGQTGLTTEKHKVLFRLSFRLENKMPYWCHQDSEVTPSRSPAIPGTKFQSPQPPSDC